MSDARKKNEDAAEPSGDVLAAAAQTPSSDDRAFVERMTRFFVHIRLPQNYRRALRAHFTGNEFQVGWALWKTSVGDQVPPSPFVDDDDAGAGSETAEILQRLDTFENLWFPRVRAMARRVAPPAERAAFEAWVFRGLSQQPLGPGVVLSVRGFLKRVSELEKSAKPHAQDLYELLSKRGLDKRARDEAGAWLTRLEEAGMLPKMPTERELRAYGDAVTEQLAAIEALRAWFNDWATTLRTVFNSREQVVLGLSVVDSPRVKSAPEPEVKAEEPVVAEEKADERAKGAKGPAEPEVKAEVPKKAGAKKKGT